MLKMESFLVNTIDFIKMLSFTCVSRVIVIFFSFLLHLC